MTIKEFEELKKSIEGKYSTKEYKNRCRIREEKENNDLCITCMSAKSATIENASHIVYLSRYNQGSKRYSHYIDKVECERVYNLTTTESMYKYTYLKDSTNYHYISKKKTILLLEQDTTKNASNN